MSTCKDCIHTDLCWSVADSLFRWKKESSDQVENLCQYFKAKNSYEDKHGKWLVTAKSYLDDHGIAPFHDYFWCTEITAICNQCGHIHQIGSDYVYKIHKFPPKGEASNRNFKFDKEAEESKALESFNKKYKLSNFCPECGYDMREGLL